MLLLLRARKWKIILRRSETSCCSLYARSGRRALELGIPAKTKHNEVAPAQHELAPVFDTTNVAVDHNQLTMEIMKKVADKHGLVCLLHEKPFEGINGSGKHNNWSMITDAGVNILDPGKHLLKIHSS